MQSGIQLGAGPNGPVCLLFGVGDPNSATQPQNYLTGSVAGVSAVVQTPTIVVTPFTADVGSLFLRTDVVDSTHQLYVKTSFVAGAVGTWTAK